MNNRYAAIVCSTTCSNVLYLDCVIPASIPVPCSLWCARATSATSTLLSQSHFRFWLCLLACLLTNFTILPACFLNSSVPCPPPFESSQSSSFTDSNTLCAVKLSSWSFILRGESRVDFRSLPLCWRAIGRLVTFNTKLLLPQGPPAQTLLSPRSHHFPVLLRPVDFFRSPSGSCP